MLDKVLRVGLLFDFYGALLTDKQQLCLKMHYLQDLSLAEIADELGVSRQAVYDILRRSEQILLDYEQKLHFAKRYQEECQTIKSIYDLMNDLPDEVRQTPNINEALKKLNCLLDAVKEG